MPYCACAVVVNSEFPLKLDAQLETEESEFLFPIQSNHAWHRPCPSVRSGECIPPTNLCKSIVNQL